MKDNKQTNKDKKIDAEMKDNKQTNKDKKQMQK